jgi:dihydrofolate reductase
MGSGASATYLEKAAADSVDGDIFMTGSATTVRWLLANGLLDELRLLLHPIAIGEGQRLFGGTSTHHLELTDSSTPSTGVLYLTYRPAA